MPYMPDELDGFSAEAGRYFPASRCEEIDRIRFVRAREHGLSLDQTVDYVYAVRGQSNAQNPARWLEDQEPEPCECGDCEECGYAEEEFYESECDESHFFPEALGFDPLARILRSGGRYFSCEVECNGLAVDTVARALSIPHESYGTKTRGACEIIAASDCTCGAEVKIGRVRDGRAEHARVARQTYDGLRNAGAFCGYNTGHHVHVDASRLCGLGSEAVETAFAASLSLAAACEPALIALAASGYSSHRDPNGHSYAGSLKDRPGQALGSRSAWHASNAFGYARNAGSYGIPTFEYRLPNGTVYAGRAHAHVAIALGLLDIGERFYDGDADAREHVARAADRVATGTAWSAADGAAILTRALALHADSLKALSAAADSSSVAPKQMREVLRIAAA